MSDKLLACPHCGSTDFDQTETTETIIDGRRLDEPFALVCNRCHRLFTTPVPFETPVLQAKEQLSKFLDNLQSLYTNSFGGALETINMEAVFARVRVLRIEQDERWGVESKPLELWLSILTEELGKVAQAMNKHNLLSVRAELTSVAAVAVAWLEQFERWDSQIAAESNEHST